MTGLQFEILLLEEHIKQLQTELNVRREWPLNSFHQVECRVLEKRIDAAETRLKDLTYIPKV